MPKDCYYFKHDSNARRDPKIIALMRKYGSSGYGNYWIIIEELREASNYKLADKEYVWLALAEQMHLTVDEARIFVFELIDCFDLLELEDGFIYSSSLLKRMYELDLIRAKRSQAGKARWDHHE